MFLECLFSQPCFWGSTVFPCLQLRLCCEMFAKWTVVKSRKNIIQYHKKNSLSLTLSPSVYLVNFALHSNYICVFWITMYNIIKVIWLFNNTTWKFKNRFQYINIRIIILWLKKTQKKNNTCHKRAHISSNNIVSNWLTNCFQCLCIRKLSSYMELINYEFTTI